MVFIDYKNEKLNIDKSKKKAIFLDRDGTIHVDKVNTVELIDLEYFSDTFSSLRKLAELGFYFVIISNQDGIRRGLYNEEKMHIFNQKIIEDFKDNGIPLLAIYYSPYSKDDNDYSFKPNPGMIFKAQEDLNICLDESYLIGDQLSDYNAGKKANVKSFIVKTGIYKTPLEKEPNYNSIKDDIFDTLDSCVNHIINLERK